MLQSINQGSNGGAGGALDALLFADHAGDGASEVYVDADGGDDDAAGTALLPLQSIGEVYRRFYWQALNGARVLIHLLNDGNSELTYETRGLWIGGGLHADQNAFAFRGPAMLPFQPSTGPNNPALDSTPAQRVDKTGASLDASGPRTRLNFTTANPGWTTNDLAGSHVLIRRSGTIYTWEAVITANDSNHLIVDHVGLVGNILATDTVLIVRPAVRIAAPTDPNSGRAILAISGHGGHRRVDDDSTSYIDSRQRYATFERIAFGTICASGAGALTFDRCMLGNVGGRGHEFTGFDVGFANTAAHVNTTVYSGGSTYPPRRRDAGITLADASVATDLQVVAPLHANVTGFRIGGTVNNGGMAGSAQYTAQAPLSVYGALGTGIIVAGPGSQLMMRTSVGRLLGTGNGGRGLAVKWGAIARVIATQNFITGGTGDVQVNAGDAVTWADFENPSIFNGELSRQFDFLQGSDQSLVTTRTTTNTSSSPTPDGAGRKPKLDDLGTPDDNTDLDATTGRHGLLPKLSADVTQFLRGDGSWAVPAHNSLSGLTTGDPHTQYALVAGTRAFTGPQDFADGSNATPGVKWPNNVGMYRSGSSLFVKTLDELVLVQGASARVKLFNGDAWTPDGGAAGAVDLGVTTVRWRTIYSQGGAFEALVAKTSSGAIATTERNTHWDGSNLTATLPTNPSHGCRLNLVNLNATALTVAAGSGDTLDASAPSSLAENVAKGYQFIAATRTWIGIS